MPRPRKHNSGAEKQRAYRERKARLNRNAQALQFEEKSRSDISRPPVRYFGSKWRIAPWIIEQFPTHTTYVEPFCGGASVFFRKFPSKIEVLNDLNHDIITFFDVLRSRPDDLINQIRLTPHSREEHKRAHQQADNQLEIARRFYIRSWQSFGSGEGKYSTGWRYETANTRGGSSVTEEWHNVDHLWATAERLLQAQIECDDALKIIERYDTPETLFYIDPPYVFSERYSTEPRYAFEMTDDEHQTLASTLHQIKGMAILSGYNSELYQALYPDWHHIKKATRTNGNHDAVEVLWLSPNTEKAQLPLFKYLQGEPCAH